MKQDIFNKLVDEMTFHNQPKLAQEILNNFGLSFYLRGLLTLLGIRDFEESLNIKMFNEQYRLVMLCYEGAIYHKFSNAEIKQLLTIALFYNVSNVYALKIFNGVNSTLTVKQQLPEEMVNIVKRSLKGYNPKTTKYVYLKILTDALAMVPYYDCEKIKAEHYQKVLREEKDLDVINKRSNKFIILDAFAKLFALQWKTKWAEIKAYKLNWPEVIKLDKQLNLETIN